MRVKKSVESEIFEKNIETVKPVTEEVKEPVIEEAKELIAETPEFVDRYLKIYSMYEELYVDKFGGVYLSTTQPDLVQDAILYKNPYFNN